MARARDLMTEALRQALRSRGISPSRAAKMAGLHDDALNAVFRGARSLPLEELDQIIDGCAIPFEELLGQMTSACRQLQKPLDPASSLASSRELSSPCFADLRIWLTYNPTVGSGEPLRDLPPQVVEIGRLRIKDREEALEQARVWVGTFRNRLRGASKGRSFRAVAVCEFAMALGIWGSIAESLGLVNDAAFALEHALRIHEKFPMTKGYAYLLLWTSQVMANFGNPEAGVLLTERAVSILTCLAAQAEIPFALVMRATMAFLAGRESEAGVIAIAIADHPESSDEYRCAARILRFHSAMKDENLLAAEIELAAAAEFLPRLEPRREAIWRWNQGRLSTARSRFDEAKAIYSSLLRSGPGMLEVADRFWIFFELVQLLGPAEDLATLREQAREMRKWIPLLDVTPLSRAIVSNFVQIAIQRFPDETALAEAKKAVKMGAPVTRPTTAVEPDQPTGLITGPSSGSSPGFDAAASAGPIFTSSASSWLRSTPNGSASGPRSASKKNDTKA